MMRTLCVVNTNQIKRKGKKKNQRKRPALNWDLKLQKSMLKNNHRETCPKAGLWKHTAWSPSRREATSIDPCFFLSFILFSIPLFLHLSLHHLHTSTSTFTLPALKHLSSSPSPGSPPLFDLPREGTQEREEGKQLPPLPFPSLLTGVPSIDPPLVGSHGSEG